MHTAIWVESSSQLEELCQTWQTADYLALDTEFIRTKTFYPQAALVQINDGKQTYLLCPLSLGKPACLQQLLVQGPTKVLHSCNEDLEVFNHWLGVLPYPLIDTQLAWGFLTANTSVGYQLLVEELTGELLPKGETLSNWLQRPLTPEQLSYAAQDVDHLLNCWYQIKERLEAAQLLDRVEEESNWLLEDYLNTQAEEAWLRIKQAWRLNPVQLAALQMLALWRENEAKQRDLPRNFIVKDEFLLALAQELPTNPRQVHNVKGLNPKWVERNCWPVINLVKQVLKLERDDLPTRLIPPHTSSYKLAKGKLLQGIYQLSTELNTSPELLARRKQQATWLQALSLKQLPEVPEKLPSWRREPLIHLFKQIISQS